MKTYTLKKITMFNNKNTKVKVEIIDGTYFAEGEGVAHCADGDDFDEETGEEIAEIRAKLDGLYQIINDYKSSINNYQKLIDTKTEQLIDLFRTRNALEQRLKQVIK